MRDAENRIARMTGALGRATACEYDSRGNRTRIVDPAGRVTDIACEASRRLSSITDPRLHSTSIEYDAQGNPSRITDPLAHSVSMASDKRHACDGPGRVGAADAELLVLTFRPLRSGATAEVKVAALNLQGAAGRTIAYEQLEVFRTAVVR